MFFQQLPARDASLSYLFGCAGKGKAIAVDVVDGDESWFVEQAEQRGVEITHVIDTHLHADHYSGGRHLAKSAGAFYCLHENAREDVRFPFEPLQHDQLLDVGNVMVGVLHTPGHTLDSISLLVTDTRRGDAPWFVITGDTLFVGAVGRPDLDGRETEMAELLYESLHDKLLSLPDDVEIYPGHQAGSACGAGLSGKPSSTLGFEKRWNPLLSMSRDAFVQAVAEVPPKPPEMERMLRVNRGFTE